MKLIVKLEEYFVVVFLALLILLVFFAAVLRWFGVSVAWSVDMAQLFFCWVCFIGADLALRQNKHVGFDMITKRFPLPVQNIIAFLLNLLMFAFCSITVVYGTNLCIQNYQRFFNTLPISYSLVTAAGPVGCALMLTTIIRRIYQNIRNFARRDFTQLNYAQVDEDMESAENYGGAA